MKAREKKIALGGRMTRWLGALRLAGLDGNPSDRFKWVLLIFLQIVCVGLFFLLAGKNVHTQPPPIGDTAEWNYKPWWWTKENVRIECSHEDAKGVVWNTY